MKLIKRLIDNIKQMFELELIVECCEAGADQMILSDMEPRLIAFTRFISCDSKMRDPGPVCSCQGSYI